MISKKEWENVVGDKMSDVIAKYNAEITSGISSKVKRAPSEEEAAVKVEDKVEWVSSGWVDSGVRSGFEIDEGKVAKVKAANDGEFNIKSLDYAKVNIDVKVDVERWINIIDGVEVKVVKEEGRWAGNASIEKVRVSPKDMGYKKNKESKSNLRDYIFYDEIGDE